MFTDKHPNLIYNKDVKIGQAVHSLIYHRMAPNITVSGW